VFVVLAENRLFFLTETEDRAVEWRLRHEVCIFRLTSDFSC